MRKILILSLQFVLLAGGAEAYERPWEYVLPTDEMTGQKSYVAEKVITRTSIEKTSYDVTLIVFCGSEGSVSFIPTEYKNSNYEEVKLDRWLKSDSTLFRVKFDNNEPFQVPWNLSDDDTFAHLFFISPYEFPNNVWRTLIKGMIKHRRLWIEFNVRSIPHIAKFDLTGFSRELAKCSKIPNTN